MYTYLYGRTDGRTLRPTLLDRLGVVDLKNVQNKTVKTCSYINNKQEAKLSLGKPTVLPHSTVGVT